jgi:polysaccharide biosynthesis transport protein
MIPGLKRRVFNFHDVMMYVALARKHVRVMTLITCACLLAGLMVYVYAKPVYYSRSLVRMESMALPLDSDKIFHDSSVPALVAQLTAPQVYERTARQLGINARYGEIISNYIRKISIKLNSEKHLEIEVWPYSRELASKWAETMVHEFLKIRAEQRIKYRESLEKSFHQEMEEINGKLDQNLGEKFDFQHKRDVTRAQIELNQFRSLPRQLVLIGQRLAAMDDIKKRLDDPTLSAVSRLALISSLNKDVEVNVGQVVSGNEADEKADEKNKRDTEHVVVIPSMVKPEQPWEGLEKEQRRLLQAIREASAIYLPGHHKMVTLQKDLETVNKQLDLEYDVARNRFDLDYANLLDRQRQLEARLPEYQTVIKKNEQIQQQFSLFQAGRLPLDSMYADMQRQLSAADWTAEKERVNLEYLGVNDLRDAPVSPNKLRIFLLSMFAGMALSIGIPFLTEYLDHTVSNFEQVESSFRMRGLGIIPKIAVADSTHLSLMDTGTSDERNLIENFRVIRTNLLSVGALTKAPHVIMVASAMPKEGKTVVSSNLAISFAQMGTKTLLIDTDLRRGRLHRLFGMRKSPGLSDVLLGELTLDDAIRPTGKENLSILSAGQHLETGTELLGSARFAAMMNDLRGRYERIIVDTPPVLGLSETSILQKFVDGVLFVIWSGRTPIRNMKTAIEMLQANGANFYGFILNRLDLSATTNYYQYYYYSNDYYHNYHALENA